MREPAGLRVLITGEGSAVSQASASLFRAHGARCSVLEDRRESGAGIHGAAVSAAEELGGLDVLVNCVGVEATGTTEPPTGAPPRSSTWRALAAPR